MNNNLHKAVILGSLGVAVALLARDRENKNKKQVRRKRKMWVKDIYLKRKEQGLFNNLIKEMQLSDPVLFFNFARMNATSFERLLLLCGNYLTKHSPREAIPPSLRLMLTLRFLATGDSYPSLAYAFRVHPSTICNIVWETCHILWAVLSPTYLKPPSEEGWLKVTQDFYNLWQMPNTLGAMDGKHIRIRAPSNSGSRFYNYKKYFSTILFAVCDAKYNFIYVDIGSYGAQSDGGVFRKSSLGQKLLSGQLNLPIGCPLPNDPNNCTVPTFFIGDEAFPLLTNLLRPYSKREKRMPEDQLIFNYRLSRGRRVIENTFGIMVARFRIFLREIHAEPETVDAIVKAVVCLHNFIKSEKIDMYYNSSVVDRDTNGTIQPGSWRDMVSENTAFQSGTVRFGNRNAAKAAWKLRDYIKEYVNGVGGDLCPWQWDCIKRTE